MKVKGTIEIDSAKKTVTIKLENGSYCLEHYTHGVKSFLDIEIQTLDGIEKLPEPKGWLEVEPSVEPTIYPWVCSACNGIQPHNVPQEDDEWECQTCMNLYTCDNCGEEVTEEQYTEIGGGFCTPCQVRYQEWKVAKNG